MSSTSSAANRQIARAAGTVMAAFVISNLIGLLRTILVARAFGTLPEMEAFTPANRVSETLFNLVAGGALASAFIPTFTGLLTRGERRGAWKLASAVSNLVLLAATLASLLAAPFNASPIVEFGAYQISSASNGNTHVAPISYACAAKRLIFIDW